jgi:two-component system, LytTR family, sensor kinase
VRRSIDPTTLSCRLPALTIQPLVENAIRHGIAPRFKGGSVAISTKSERGMLLLSVSDDGVGVEPEQALTSAGLGLRTIQQRIFLYSRGTSFFAVEGKRGEGFAVSIALPLEKPEEEENVSLRRLAELSTR